MYETSERCVELEEGQEPQHDATHFDTSTQQEVVEDEKIVLLQPEKKTQGICRSGKLVVNLRDMNF